MSVARPAPRREESVSAMTRCRLVALWLEHEQRKSRRPVALAWERVAARVSRLARRRVTTVDVVRWLSPRRVADRRVRVAIEVLSADCPGGPISADKW